jgi:hypothetical protein
MTRRRPSPYTWVLPLRSVSRALASRSRLPGPDAEPTNEFRPIPHSETERLPSESGEVRVLQPLVRRGRVAAFASRVSHGGRAGEQPFAAAFKRPSRADVRGRARHPLARRAPAGVVSCSGASPTVTDPCSGLVPAPASRALRIRAGRAAPLTRGVRRDAKWPRVQAPARVARAPCGRAAGRGQDWRGNGPHRDDHPPLKGALPSSSGSRSRCCTWSRSACLTPRRRNTSAWRCSSVCALVANALGHGGTARPPESRRDMGLDDCIVSRPARRPGAPGTTPQCHQRPWGAWAGLRRPPPGWARARGSRSRPPCAQPCPGVRA